MDTGYIRHIVLDIPDKEEQAQIFEYETNMVVWLGTSPEIYTPNMGRTIRDISNNFINALQANGCVIVSDRCALFSKERKSVVFKLTNA